jgi:hypothetical protein
MLVLSFVVGHPSAKDGPERATGPVGLQLAPALRLSSSAAPLSELGCDPRPLDSEPSMWLSGSDSHVQWVLTGPGADTGAPSWWRAVWPLPVWQALQSCAAPPAVEGGDGSAGGGGDVPSSTPRIVALGMCVRGGQPGSKVYLGEVSVWTEHLPSPAGGPWAPESELELRDVKLRVTAAESREDGHGRGGPGGGGGGGGGGHLASSRVGVVVTWSCPSPSLLHCDVLVDGRFAGRSSDGVLFLEVEVEVDSGVDGVSGAGGGTLGPPPLAPRPLVCVCVVPTTTRGVILWAAAVYKTLSL